jgi:acyl-CoA synthetase (AMP-forming)/AMP-acid ligase II
MINRVANAFAERGFDTGDRVAILTRNCIAQGTTYFAAQKLGAVAVPMNFRLSLEDLVHICTESETRALIYDAE